MSVDTIIAIVLTAIITGCGGYLAALVRNNTRLAILERDTKDNKTRWENCQSELKVIAEENRHRLAMLLRIVIDLARKNDIVLRTADLLEIASLGPTEPR